SAKASGPHTCQSIGLSACWLRYGLVASASRCAIVCLLRERVDVCVASTVSSQAGAGAADVSVGTRENVQELVIHEQDLPAHLDVTEEARRHQRVQPPGCCLARDVASIDDSADPAVWLLEQEIEELRIPTSSAGVTCPFCDVILTRADRCD